MVGTAGFQVALIASMTAVCSSAAADRRQAADSRRPGPDRRCCRTNVPAKLATAGQVWLSSGRNRLHQPFVGLAFVGPLCFGKRIDFRGQAGSPSAPAPWRNLPASVGRPPLRIGYRDRPDLPNFCISIAMACGDGSPELAGALGVADAGAGILGCGAAAPDDSNPTRQYSS